MSKQDFMVVILGSDENAYGDSRLIYEEYGIKPILMCSRRLVPTCYSNILQIIETKDFDKTEIFVETLLNELKKLHLTYEKVLVVPCADYYTELLVSNYDKFEGLIANKFISKDLMDKFYSKTDFYELCEKNGLSYPKTYVAKFDDRLQAIDKIDFDFPIVVKPQNSNAYEYLHAEFEGKKKVYFFFNKDEYINTINEMNKSIYKGDLIIQEFIIGGDDAGRVVNSYCDNSSNVIASSIGQPIIEEYAPKMLGNYAAIITRNDKKLYEMISSFLKSINYVGFSNIDLKYDKKTGRYLAFELNPRLGRSSFYVNSTGLNMMKVIIDDVVYGKKQKTIFEDKTALWTNVPIKTIKTYVKDKTLKEEALNLIKLNNFKRTLVYNKDRNLKRFLSIRRYYEVQHQSFKKYYFEKNELGLNDS